MLRKNGSYDDDGKSENGRGKESTKSGGDLIIMETYAASIIKNLFGK